jgi:methyl-accepting chemotaxis protein
MTGNSVFNVTWDSNASQKGIERAAKQIVDAVEKGTQHVVDVSKNPQKVVDAIKAGSEKIVDAVGKIKNTTNAEQTVAPVPAVEAVCQGLTNVSKTTAQIADYFYSHPNEWAAVGEKIGSVNEQFTKLGESVKRYSEGREQLQTTTGEVAKATDWISSNFPSGGGGNVQTIHVGNGAFPALWQRYGG